jgi:hypothetical protein
MILISVICYVVFFLQFPFKNPARAGGGDVGLAPYRHPRKRAVVLNSERGFILHITHQMNYYGDHIEEDELGGTCGIHERNEK